MVVLIASVSWELTARRRHDSRQWEFGGDGSLGAAQPQPRLNRWFLGFLVMQLVALFLALRVDPAGFDTCEARPSAAEQRTEWGLAVVAVVGSTVLAVRWLRGWRLGLAVLLILTSGAAWFSLIRPSGNC